MEPRLFDPDPGPADGWVEVRVSVASMLQRFHGCEPDFIRDVCHARCCDAPSRPGGTLVTIHRSEEDAIRARGGTVEDGLLVTDGVCTFKTDDHLCGLHFTPDKPFGCWASPFTLNRSDCLIVRNRYRFLPCYVNGRGQPDDIDTSDWPPAYVAFRGSLEAIFGEVATAALVRDVEEAVAANGPSMVRARMPERSYEALHANDETKRRAG